MSDNGWALSATLKACRTYQTQSRVSDRTKQLTSGWALPSPLAHVHTETLSVPRVSMASLSASPRQFLSPEEVHVHRTDHNMHAFTCRTMAPHLVPICPLLVPALFSALLVFTQHDPHIGVTSIGRHCIVRS